MKPLHISLEILSPVLLPKYPVHLDALLYAALKDNSDMDDESILKIIDGILDKQNGVYKSSAMRFLKSNHFPLTSIQWSFATRTHWEDWEFSQNEKSKNIITKGGGFRKRVTTYNAIQSHAVDFNAVGEPEEIHYLLSCLGFIGLNNNQGFGEIGNITIAEIEEDFSFIDDEGELARCLPISMVPEDVKNTVMQLKNSVKPPYQSSERILACLPNFRTKHIN